MPTVVLMNNSIAFAYVDSLTAIPATEVDWATAELMKMNEPVGEEVNTKMVGTSRRIGITSSVTRLQTNEFF